MLFLIFPKKFERNLFLISIEAQIVFFFKFRKLPRTFVLGVRELPLDPPAEVSCSPSLSCSSTSSSSSVPPSSPTDDIQTYFMMISHIDDSDIGFNIEYHEFLQNVRLHFETQIKNFLFVLCGTCGGSASDPTHKVGSCYAIRFAVKFDRGEIGPASTPTHFQYKLRSEKRLVEKAQKLNLELEDYPHAVTLSSNFLLNCDPKDFARVNSIDLSDLQRPSNPNHQPLSVVGEMETFDFFSISRHHGKLSRHQYACLRIISDISGSPDLSFINSQLAKLGLKPVDISPTNPILLQHLHTLGRKSLDMSELGETVLKLANSNLLTYSYYLCKEEIENWLKHSQTDTGTDAKNSRCFLTVVTELDVLMLNSYAGHYEISQPDRQYTVYVIGRIRSKITQEVDALKREYFEEYETSSSSSSSSSSTSTSQPSRSNSKRTRRS